MSNEEYEALHKGDKVNYGLFTNIEYWGEFESKGVAHVVLRDKNDNEKQVYRSLFLKHGSIPQ